jgi:hypothetical protein
MTTEKQKRRILSDRIAHKNEYLAEQSGGPRRWYETNPIVRVPSDERGQPFVRGNCQLFRRTDGMIALADCSLPIAEQTIGLYYEHEMGKALTALETADVHDGEDTRPVAAVLPFRSRFVDV